ncbi:MAG: MarR family transcriptional regulator [Bacillota bacterium]|nr:MarR family transcriptional regulator [Bacillota bacterium]MDI7250052.1 MarR family transcriptional regulator [Bacillota bacterium]
MAVKDEQAQRLRGVMKRLVRAIGLLERGDAACCGITLAQCHALGEVAAHEGLTSGELASRLGVDPSAATRMVDALVRQGLVHRKADVSDRRVVRLALTSRGRRLWSLVDESMTERSRAVLRRLPPDRQETVLEACEQLVQALEREEYLLPCASKQGGTCRGSA